MLMGFHTPLSLCFAFLGGETVPPAAGRRWPPLACLFQWEARSFWFLCPWLIPVPSLCWLPATCSGISCIFSIVLLLGFVNSLGLGFRVLVTSGTVPCQAFLISGGISVPSLSALCPRPSLRLAAWMSVARVTLDWLMRSSCWCVGLGCPPLLQPGSDGSFASEPSRFPVSI